MPDLDKPYNSNISPVGKTSPNQLGSITMSSYISFCVLFFIICVVNDLSIKVYIIVFWICTFIIQFSMNLYASNSLCTKSNPGKAFGYTMMPWLFVLGIASVILYFMPGWVRVFSNTIGIAVAKSIYSELFKIDPSKYNDNDNGNNQLIQTIYNDPSKLINEVEYKPGFAIWVIEIYNKHLKSLTFFNDDKFKEKDESDLKYPTDPNDDTFNQVFEKKSKEKNTDLYQLYKCIAVKEKVGYFVWLFLIGCISVMVSLDQVLNSDCF